MSSDRFIRELSENQKLRLRQRLSQSGLKPHSPAIDGPYVIAATLLLSNLGNNLASGYHFNSLTQIELGCLLRS
jgi:hypothetical protein